MDIVRSFPRLCLSKDDITCCESLDDVSNASKNFDIRPRSTTPHKIPQATNQGAFELGAFIATVAFASGINRDYGRVVQRYCQL